MAPTVAPRRLERLGNAVARKGAHPTDRRPLSGGRRRSDQRSRSPAVQAGHAVRQRKRQEAGNDWLPTSTEIGNVGGRSTCHDSWDLLLTVAHDSADSVVFVAPVGALAVDLYIIMFITQRILFT